MAEQAKTQFKLPASNVDPVAYYDRAAQIIADDVAYHKEQGWTRYTAPDENMLIAFALVLQDHALVRGESTLNMVLMPDSTDLGSNPPSYAAGEQWVIYSDPEVIELTNVRGDSPNVRWQSGEPCPHDHLFHSLMTWGCWFNDPNNYDFYAHLTNREQA